MHIAQAALWHGLFEIGAYVTGVAVYSWTRRWAGDGLPSAHRWIVTAIAAFGAAIGSRIPGAVQALALGPMPSLSVLSGRTIVGAILGGTFAVEIAKRALRIRRSTGDAYALPLVAAIAVGRVGCLLAGTHDETHGIPTTHGWWGIDYGDGIPRHPVQLYEIAFLLVLGAYLIWRRTRLAYRGQLFAEFSVGYLAFRLGMDFLKPYPVVCVGLGAIQCACLAGLIYYTWRIPKLRREERGDDGAAQIETPVA
jgi:phosphatidylglycerol---prolipoprotein diacylglyceryl transferase